ncbi:MAG: 30S ribosomal protein S4 [Acidobacteria bacterium]|nr:30S ribosomal protein S4 [Acidobacteriota bacterium]
MARYRGSVCRLCRREGMKLFLKGQRCFSEKCAVEKRSWAPGEHGKDTRSKVLGYGVQLREKQKVKRLYGILENQFRNYFEKAVQQRGITGERLLTALERRLDTVLLRVGFGSSPAHARQMVRHGHVLVNGRKVNIPSCQVNRGDVITLKPKAQKNQQVHLSVDLVSGQGLPQWLELDKESFQTTVRELPRREDIRLPIEEQLIVELYSK